MKKLLRVLLLVAAISSIAAMPSHAVDRCAVALRACLTDCQFQPVGLQISCATGCNIGYLLCDWDIAF
jgi:hypothetical protein